MMLSAIHGDDWFSRSEPFMSSFDHMENEIAELRTLTKVTRLRQQIECRHEGEWLVVRDVPDDKSKGGTRKVTAYGRATRSVTRSVSQHVDFDGRHGLFNGGLSHRDDFPRPDLPGSVVVEFPDEPVKPASPKSEVEIVEIASEAVKSSVPSEENVPVNKSSPAKKTSVVTLGKGNLVFIDSEDSDPHFRVTGISKGKVADVVNTLESASASDEKTPPRRPKKVGFSKTEVHFAPDSGRVKIVETDEKPPPTQLLRKKRRPRSFPERANKSNFPKLYFGDEEKQQFPSDTDIKIPTEHVFPVLRELSPLLSTRDILNPLRSSSNAADASPSAEDWSRKPNSPRSTIGRTSPESRINYLKSFSTGEIESRLADSTCSKPSANNVYLGKVSPKLSKLLQNSMQHEFQLKHLQIVGKKVEDQPSSKPNVFNIKLEPDPPKKVSQVQLEASGHSVETSGAPTNTEPLYINREVIVPENRRSATITTVKVKTPKPKPRTSITKITDGSSFKVTSTSTSDDSKKLRSITRNPTPDSDDLKKAKAITRTPTQDLRRSVTPSSRQGSQISKKEVAEVKPLKSYTRNTVSRQSEVCRKSCRTRTESLSTVANAATSITAVHKSSTTGEGSTGSGRGGSSSKKPREPLRSFEKVSNGWVGHCIVPIKSTTSSSPGAKVCITANIYATPLASAKPSGPKRSTGGLSESKTGVRCTKEDKLMSSTSFPSNRQFSLSKEHLKSAKLVKELVTKDSTEQPLKGETATTRVTAAKPKVNVVRPRMVDSTRRHSGVSTGLTTSSATVRSTPASRTTTTTTTASKAAALSNRRRFQSEDNYGRLRRDSERSDDSVVRADEEVRAYMLNTRHKMKSGDLLDEMSASYSEICDAPDEEDESEKADELPLERPRVLPLPDRLSRLEGTVSRLGDMITFVADDLETKIKLSSPNSCPDRPWSPRGAATLLEDLEVEASALAASVDSLAEALSETLHGISALTVDCLETYRDVVCKTCDAVDANIKAMYQLMAKCEEISKSMSPIYKLSAHIKQIKHVLDLLEASPG